MTTAGSGEAAAQDPREPLELLTRDLRCGLDGLSSREASRRLVAYGPNGRSDHRTEDQAEVGGRATRRVGERRDGRLVDRVPSWPSASVPDDPYMTPTAAFRRVLRHTCSAMGWPSW
jgi:hypothetical protein